MATDTLVYHGGPHHVVALDRIVSDGDTVELDDPRLWDQLLAASGFTLEDGTNPLVQEVPEPAPREALETQADLLGLAIYPTEEDAGLAERINAAGGDATLTDPEAARAEAEKPAKALTPKEKAEARATELGLSTSGTKADIEKRISDEEERLAQDQGSSTGGEGTE